MSGLLAGLASFVFLRSLEWVGDAADDYGWLLFLLPLGGFAIGMAGLRWGGRASAGNRLTMSEIADFGDGVPLRMAPMVLGGTLITHLFSGSAGREGTALQMAAGLTDGFAARLGLEKAERRVLLIPALAAGFGSVFGVPWAGVVFALEVAPVEWSVRRTAIPGSVIAALLGDAVVGWLGETHQQFPSVSAMGAGRLIAIAAIAPAFGVCAWLFIRLTDLVRDSCARIVSRAPLRPVLGGSLVVIATLLIGNRDYNGLSTELLDRAFGLAEIGLGVWALKLVLTALTVGSGFVGGEVTPLFVMGGTLGAAIGHATNQPVVALTAAGMLATFGAAVNAPVACVVMGVELFGWRALGPVAVACFIARLCSSGRSLYHDDRVPREAEFV